jgi:uncharacterized protein (DUF1697 family)
MKYVAFLRGINVGGNSLVKMADLKKTVEDVGFEDVITYINSGNIIFESKEKRKKEILKTLERAFLKTFKFNIYVVVLTHTELQTVLKNVPKDWKTRKDIRRYISFLFEGLTPQEAISQIDLKEGIDFIKSGANVLYMTTKLSGLMKSNFRKLITKKIYKLMTMRNYNTCQKVLGLMES